MNERKPAFQKKNLERGKSIQDYWPLICLTLISILGGMALNWGIEGSGSDFMHYFMGLFLVIFALLKLFHPVSFANGFQMYDLLAKRYKGYAYVYPLIELALGLAFLSFWVPVLTYIVTIIVMIFGALGVFNALREGLDIYCPCMGTILEVPLSTVTIVENLGMALLSLIMLFTI